MGRPRAFTIVELLVVVTIIVVLLALLAPAVDRAVYQAELAVCSGNLKGMAGGTLVYAAHARRFYPDRPVANAGNQLTVVLRINSADDRLVLSKFMPIQTLVDPLVKSVDLTTAESTWIQNAFYSLWFDVRFPNEKGMHKLGDRWTWTDNYTAQPGIPLSLEYLASDTDSITNQGTGRNIASHPSDDGRMFMNFWQDVPTGQTAAVGEATGTAPQGQLTASYWDLTGAANNPRGPADFNFALADGAVVRHREVKIDDDRVAAVPFNHNGANWSVWRVQLPR